MSATGNRPGQRQRQDGFTLFELLVALGILALATGIGFPVLERQMARRALAEARATVVLALATARADAVAGDMPVEVAQGSESRLVFSNRRTTLPLPEGAGLTLPEGGLRFFADGGASGGDIAIRMATGASLHLTVDPVNGRVRGET